MNMRIKSCIVALCILTGSAQIGAMQQNPYLMPRPTFGEHCKNIITGAGQGAAKMVSAASGLRGAICAIWAALYGMASVCDLFNLHLAIFFKDNELCTSLTNELKYDAKSAALHAVEAALCLTLAKVSGKYAWPDANQ